MEGLVRLVDRLAERYGGVSYYEVRLIRVTSSHVSMQNGRPEELGGTNTETGIGVRAFNGGAWGGFSSANDMGRAEKAVETAMKIAKLSEGNSRIHLGDPVVEEVEIRPKKSFLDVNIGDKLALVKEVDSLLRGGGGGYPAGASVTAMAWRRFFTSTPSEARSGR